jgi:hypothetical protein
MELFKIVLQISICEGVGFERPNGNKINKNVIKKTSLQGGSFKGHRYFPFAHRIVCQKVEQTEV